MRRRAIVIRSAALMMCAALFGCLLLQAVRADAGTEAAGPFYVALTFDDGPSPVTTEALLDGLRQRGASATFFLIGEQIAGNEELIARMVREGHQVGLHTWSHRALRGCTVEEIRAELEPEREALAALTGCTDLWLRPPYGFCDETVLTCADAPVILWSVDPEDWSDRDTARIVAAVTEAAGPGDIILLHDIYPSSTAAALAIVDTLRERGAVFVTVEELLVLHGVSPAPGEVYRRVPNG